MSTLTPYSRRPRTGITGIGVKNLDNGEAEVYLDDQLPCTVLTGATECNANHGGRRPPPESSCGR
jgi:hypothetical protein